MSKDFSKSKEYVDLYVKIATKKYIEICKYKNEMIEFCDYVKQYIEDNPKTDIRNSSLTIYLEKITNIYNEKRNRFYSRIFNSLLILGTFLMVIASYINIFTN